MIGFKHLISCRCILSQFKKASEPVFHQFIVFSIIDDNDIVKEKFVQCPNCDIVHKVHEIGKSEIVNDKEDMSSVTTIDDISLFLNDKLVQILVKNNVSIASYEEIQFVIENEEWGRSVVIARETVGDQLHIKSIMILGENNFKIDTEQAQNLI